MQGESVEHRFRFWSVVYFDADSGMNIVEILLVQNWVRNKWQCRLSTGFQVRTPKFPLTGPRSGTRRRVRITSFEWVWCLFWNHISRQAGFGSTWRHLGSISDHNDMHADSIACRLDGALLLGRNWFIQEQRLRLDFSLTLCVFLT